MGVSNNSGTPKSSIFIGFSIINHPFWGTTIFGNTHTLSNNIKRQKKEKTDPNLEMYFSSPIWDESMALLGGSSQDGRKWLMTMVSFRPVTGVLGPRPNGLSMA